MVLCWDIFICFLAECRALEKFWPDLKQISLVDRSAGMLEMAQKLTPEAFKAKVLYHQFAKPLFGDPHPLVIASFVLMEASSDVDRKCIVDALWNHSCSDTLVLIEWGGPEGFRILRDARDQILLSQKGECFIVAPVSAE